MTPSGQQHDALVLAEVAPNGTLSATCLWLLAPILPDLDYTLVNMDRASARARFARIGTVSFTHGTHITLSSGVQVPIEDLEIGDPVLTRNAGAQPAHWIGQTTHAKGAFAPVAIRAGTLNNENDLVISPEHRLFIYQYTDRIGAGQSEILVKARHLVNDDTIRIQYSGFVDYFQLLFDRHHIFYAEGIAAESMLVDTRTRPGLLSEVQNILSSQAPSDHGLEVHETLLNHPNVADLLRRASRA